MSWQPTYALILLIYGASGALRRRLDLRILTMKANDVWNSGKLEDQVAEASRLSGFAVDTEIFVKTADSMSTPVAASVAVGR